MRNALYLVLLIAVGCANTTAPLATDPIDWPMLDDHWSLHVVTIDPDGDERVTRVWLAVVDGQGAIRTNESRWWRNLERDPRIRIRLSGTDYALRSESVTDLEARARIDEAFLAKYGRWERMMFSQERGKTHVHYATLHSDGI
jgi:hypothetical protein